MTLDLNLTTPYYNPLNIASSSGSHAPREREVEAKEEKTESQKNETSVNFSRKRSAENTLESEPKILKTEKRRNQK